MRERFQNPVLGDTINLRLFVYNANNARNVEKVEKIEIYKLDDLEKTTLNPDGDRLIQTIADSEISLENTGEYLSSVLLSEPLYTIGKYKDVWFIKFEEDSESSTQIANYFQIKRDMWITDVAPIVHDFQFRFKPNSIPKGSKKWVTIEAIPSVPRGTDLERYYRNLINLGVVNVTIRQKCGECLPAENDLRIVVENTPATFNDGHFAYYFIDTTDMDCGIYDVQFSISMGENCFMSEFQQLMIF